MIIWAYLTSDLNFVWKAIVFDVGGAALLKAHIKHTQTHGNVHSGCLTSGSDFSIYTSYNDVKCREHSQCTVLHRHFTIVKKLRINKRNIHAFWIYSQWMVWFRKKNNSTSSILPTVAAFSFYSSCSQSEPFWQCRVCPWGLTIFWWWWDKRHNAKKGRSSGSFLPEGLSLLFCVTVCHKSKDLLN